MEGGGGRWGGGVHQEAGGEGEVVQGGGEVVYRKVGGEGEGFRGGGEGSGTYSGG